jgi:hypothetical protein
MIEVADERQLPEPSTEERIPVGAFVFARDEDVRGVVVDHKKDADGNPEIGILSGSRRRSIPVTDNVVVLALSTEDYAQRVATEGINIANDRGRRDVVDPVITSLLTRPDAGSNDGAVRVKITTVGHYVVRARHADEFTPERIAATLRQYWYPQHGEFNFDHVMHVNDRDDPNHNTVRIASTTMKIVDQFTDDADEASE